MSVHDARKKWNRMLCWKPLLKRNMELHVAIGKFPIWCVVRYSLFKNSPCDTSYPFQHFSIQIIIVDCVIVLAIFGIGVMVGASYQRCRSCFQRFHHQGHSVSALGTKGQVFEYVIKIVLFRISFFVLNLYKFNIFKKKLNLTLSVR